MPTVERARNNLIKELVKMNACKESLRWVKNNNFSTPKAVWENCKDGSRMMWMLRKVGVPLSYQQEAIIRMQKLIANDIDPNYLLNKINTKYWNADDICLAIYWRAYYTGNHRLLLKKCSDIVRKTVPWYIVRDALDKWRKENK